MNVQNLDVRNLISQSNKLIESRYNLNITEQRLILAMISMISPEDEDFREYNIKISSLNKVLGLKNKNIYNEIKNITESIMTKVIKIKKPTGLLQINWISSAYYNDELGTVSLKFDPSLKPYLLNIKENYTSTKFGITAKFKSFYTTRIYLLVKQYEKIGKRIVSVDFLKEIFPQYPLYKDIKRRILLSAQKEIKDNSDIKFDIKENKLGKKVTEVVFYNIKPVQTQMEIPLHLPAIKNETLPELINRKYKVELSIATKLEEELKSENKKEEFDKIFKYIDYNIFNKDIKNIAGFVVDCIRKGYYKNHKEVKEETPLKTQELQTSTNNKKTSINNKNKFFIKLMKELETNSQEDAYQKWLVNLNFYEREGNKIYLATLNSKFFRDWIIKEYLDKLIYPCAVRIDSTIESVDIIDITKHIE